MHTEAGVDPGLVAAGYTVGPDVVLLCLGLLLPEDPDPTGDQSDSSWPGRR